MSYLFNNFTSNGGGGNGGGNGAQMTNRYVKKSSSGTILETDAKIYTEISSAITLTLPSVGSPQNGQYHIILNRSISTANVTVDTSDTDTVDGGATFTLLPGEYVEFIYDDSNTNWFILN